MPHSEISNLPRRTSHPLVGPLLLLCLVTSTHLFGQETFKVQFALAREDPTKVANFSPLVDRWVAHLNQFNESPTVEAAIRQDKTEIFRDLVRSRIHAAVIYTSQWTQSLADRNQFEPALFFGPTPTGLNRFLILTSNRQIEEISDLKGKKVLVTKATVENLPVMWLESLLQKSWQEAGINLAEKASAFDAIVPVFFGQAAACIISRDDFERNARLSHQFVSELKILAESDPIPSRMLVFRKQLVTRDRELILNRSMGSSFVLRDYNFLEPDCDIAIPFDPKIMNSIKKLVSDYENAHSGGDSTEPTESPSIAPDAKSIQP